MPTRQPSKPGEHFISLDDLRQAASALVHSFGRNYTYWLVYSTQEIGIGDVDCGIGRFRPTRETRSEVMKRIKRNRAAFRRGPEAFL
jgi:hypothetical protein